MKQKGQALIILIVVIAISLVVLSGVILFAIGQAKISARSKLASQVYYAAETGAEYALMKIMRDPTSCSVSDSLNLDSTVITISYNQSGPDCIITSEANKNNIVKKIQVQAYYDANQMFNYSNWSQIP
ncbi:MAG: hypothetical protein WD187_02790 [Candidatus Woykebacteria bacterium]